MATNSSKLTIRLGDRLNLQNVYIINLKMVMEMFLLERQEVKEWEIKSKLTGILAAGVLLAIKDPNGAKYTKKSIQDVSQDCWEILEISAKYTQDALGETILKEHGLNDLHPHIFACRLISPELIKYLKSNKEGG